MKSSFIILALLICGITGNAESSDIYNKRPDQVFDNLFLPLDAATGDLNGDGLTDIAIIHCGDKKWNSELRLHYGKPDAVFSNTPDRIFKYKHLVHLKIRDFDGDGKNDIALQCRSKFFYLLLGKDNFNRKISDASCNQYRNNLACGNITGKGKFDFLIGPVLRTWEGGDNFRESYMYPPRDTKKRILNRFAYIHDFDRDNNMDILFVGKGGSEYELRIYYGPFLKTGKIWPHMLHKLGKIKTPAFPVSPQILDVDGDSQEDIVFTSPKNKTIYFWGRTRLGDFTENIEKFSEGDSFNYLGVADFNNDGKKDLAAITTRGKFILFLFHPPAEIRKPSSEIQLEPRTRFFHALDVNSDKNPDLLSADRNKVYLRFNKSGKSHEKN